MGRDAKTALDSGNILFRARSYDRALAQYRRSARLAPTELAPLLGILMVTDVTKNAKLADSTLSRMRELNPGAAVLRPQSRMPRSLTLTLAPSRLQRCPRKSRRAEPRPG